MHVVRHPVAYLWPNPPTLVMFGVDPQQGNQVAHDQPMQFCRQWFFDYLSMNKFKVAVAVLRLRRERFQILNRVERGIWNHRDIS